jgi:hypothetical protein
MTLSRVKVVNGGSPGGNAVTNFYFRSVSGTELTALGAFITACKPYLPSTITYTIPSSGDTIDEATGALTGSWSATAPSPIAGTGVNMAGTPIGIEVAWLAAAVVDNHRPVGKTLWVPASATGIGNNGAVAPAAITAMNSAAATFLASAVNFAIWHRPRKASAGPPPVTFRPGLAMTPGGAVTRPLVCVLRSRRS